MNAIIDKALTGIDVLADSICHECCNLPDPTLADLDHECRSLRSETVGERRLAVELTHAVVIALIDKRKNESAADRK